MAAANQSLLARPVASLHSLESMRVSARERPADRSRPVASFAGGLRAERSRWRTDDLRALIDALGQGIGGSVIVTDQRLEVLEHHVGTAHPSAEISEWILRRVPPQTARRQLIGGRLTDNWSTGDVVRLGGSRTETWMLSLVRDGAEVVGGVWGVGRFAVADAQAGSCWPRRPGAWRR